MNFTLSKDLGDRVFAYLLKQPYQEVVDLIEGLKNLQPIPEKPAEPVVETPPQEEAKPEAQA